MNMNPGKKNNFAFRDGIPLYVASCTDRGKCDEEKASEVELHASE
jgi:hypothetical protein